MIRFVGIFLEALISIIIEIIGTATDAISSLGEPRRNIEFKAKFVPATSLTWRYNRGFCIDGRSCLTLEQSYRNLWCIGGTGCGKTSNILIPSVLLMARSGSSMVINDPSGEILKLTSGYLLKLDYEVQVLDYNNIKGECYNPLKRCKSISDIQKLTSLLVRNTLGTEVKDPFWSKSAESLLTLFLRYLIFHSEPQFQTLHNVLHLINEFAGRPEKIDRLFVRTKDSKLLAEYRAFVSYGEKTLASIIATAKATLSLFSDETVAAITSHDTIDFSAFRREKVALFVNYNVTETKYYSPLSALFFGQFLHSLLEKIPDKSDNSIFFMLDEASSIHLPSLSTTISNIRKYRGGILLVYQDYHQLEHNYGTHEAKNIAANCYSKIYLPNQPLATCQMLEATLGRFQYEDEAKVRRTRPLMTADEIRMTDKAVILLGNHSPIHTKLHPFYENLRFKWWTNYPPYKTNNILPFDEPPLINLSDEA